MTRSSATAPRASTSAVCRSATTACWAIRSPRGRAPASTSSATRASWPLGGGELLGLDLDELAVEQELQKSLGHVERHLLPRPLAAGGRGVALELGAADGRAGQPAVVDRNGPEDREPGLLDGLRRDLPRRLVEREPVALLWADLGLERRQPPRPRHADGRPERAVGERRPADVEAPLDGDADGLVERDRHGVGRLGGGGRGGKDGREGHGEQGQAHRQGGRGGRGGAPQRARRPQVTAVPDGRAGRGGGGPPRPCRGSADRLRLPICHPERAERVDREATAQPRISEATPSQADAESAGQGGTVARDPFGCAQDMPSTPGYALRSG